MSSISRLFQYVKKSEFVRSIFFRVMAVFLVIVILLVLVIYYSFGTELNKSVASDSRKQLTVIEDTISSRMSEVISIAYNIGQDSAFFLTPVSGIKQSGYEMAERLSRYLVGNDFIKYLAYYRLSEPDIIYTSRGMLSYHRFWDSYLHGENYTDESFLEAVKGNTGGRLIPICENGKVSYFSYVCPLPQFSTNPRAFVIALIPSEAIESVLSSQLANRHGEISVFDAGGELIHQISTQSDNVDTVPTGAYGAEADYAITQNGSRYVVQEQVSEVNNWSYVSVIRLDDVVSGLASTQIIVLIAVLVLMIIAVSVILISIVSKYEPISKLALTLTDQSEQHKGIIDEKSLLTDTIATLKLDSEQKQKFESAYQEATEASKAKSAFLSNMSHDIRTPMNAIIGMIGIAKKHLNDSAYVGECLGKAEVASRYLLDIINNVLDMSRIESGKIVLSEGVIALPKLIREIVTIIHPGMEEKQQRFIVEAHSIKNESVVGDSVRMTQVFMNILSNATKFTPNGGTIQMDIRQGPAMEDGCAMYTFRFTDTGAGMTKDFVTKVFDSFTREHEAGTSTVEGTGLGMAIAKNLVELMGGEITCDSQVGVGTAFTVSLRLKTVEEVLTEQQKECMLRCKGKTALVVGGGERVYSRQKELLAGLGLKTVYIEEAKDTPSPEGGAPLFLLFNPSEKGHLGIEAAACMYGGKKPPSTKYILVTDGFQAVDAEAAENAGIDTVVNEPLFCSTVLDMFTGKRPTKTLPVAADVVADLSGKRVLLVEDNSMNREIAKKVIGETNATVEEAVNGKEAVEMFSNQPEGYYDCILMDIQMPIMDGYEATAQIRSMKRADAGTVPILAMTANTFSEDVQQVRKAGMNGHLGKPYSPEEFYHALSLALRR